MIHNIFSVFLSWQVLLITSVLAFILCLVFVKIIKNKKTRKIETPKKAPESAGKLVVPSSTYEMLKKEKRIHNVDNN